MNKVTLTLDTPENCAFCCLSVIVSTDKAFCVVSGRELSLQDRCKRSSDCPLEENPPRDCAYCPQRESAIKLLANTQAENVQNKLEQYSAFCSFDGLSACYICKYVACCEENAVLKAENEKLSDDIVDLVKQNTDVFIENKRLNEKINDMRIILIGDAG